MGIDPFWPDRHSPKLTTPQWVGEEGVDAVITLSIDDMRDTARYEKFIRPILEKVKEVSAGRAPFSIFTCVVPPDDAQLQTWLKEGVSIEVHTLKHPCPLLQGGDFKAAKDTVDGCIDLLSQIPGGEPVCYRMPCCDSMSSPSPRFYAEIFHKTTPGGNFLTLDSSVACILTGKDTSIPKELTTDAQGRDRFWKYYSPKPNQAKSMNNFGTYIEDYPYPYLIGERCWELPITMPSDWLAQNCQGKNNPETVEDWKVALDIIVKKQGVMNLCFHPHGWIQAEQMVQFIAHAHAKYGRRVRFMSFRDVQEKLAKLDPAKHRRPRKAIAKADMPPGVTLLDAQGRDNGVRFVDLNGDGHDDIVFSNADKYGVYVFNPTEKKNVDWRVGWTFVMREGKAGDANSIPQIIRADGSDNGVWFKHGSMWVQNEDTAKLPGVVRRIPFEQLLKQPGPPPRSPEESLKALHVKPGFTAELVAAEPLVQDPVFIDWDERGRLWVVEMGDYPFSEKDPKSPPFAIGKTTDGKPSLNSGRVKILEDTDRNGVYDKATVFLDDLKYPTGLAHWKGGIFIASVPEVFYAEDTNGDGKADKRTSILTGFTEGNPQHLVNGFAWGLDGWLYGGNGDSGGKVVEVKSGKTFDLSGRDFRFNPATGEFQLQAGRTQYGRWRDDFGNWFGCNNSSLGWHYVLDERYLARNPKLAVPTLRRTVNNRPDNKRVFPVSAPLRRFNWPDAVNTLTSACSPMPYRDTLFGEGYANSMFICEPANNLVHHEVLEPDGISFRSRRADDEMDREFLASEDNWFRPTMARTGPDGCLYIVDMYRLVLEHPEWIPKQMQAHLDLRAGEDRGRIYRIKPEDLKETRAYPWEGDDRLVWDPSSAVSLAFSLGGSSGWKADTAQRLLIEKKAEEVVPILAGWLEGAASDEPPFPASANVRALWSLHTLGGLTAEGLGFALQCPQPLTRMHAVQLAEHHLKDKEILERVCKLAADPDFRVRVQVALTLGESQDARVPAILRELAKRDEGNKDMLTAILTSVTKHEATLSREIPQWHAALKGDARSANTPTPVIITNASPDREKVVKQYAPAAQLTGDPARGHALYTNVCAACHRLKNEGTEIGPDLGMVAAKPAEQIIEAILDPNRAVESRYLTQTLSTKQGREIIGLITEETPNSLTLRTATGVETILRADITKRSATTKSLMPDGMETLLTPQHVADLLAWIRAK